MRPDAYFWALSEREQEEYARRAGTSRAYLKNYAYPRDKQGRGRPRVEPSGKRVCDLALASGGFVAPEESFQYFFGHHLKKLKPRSRRKPSARLRVNGS